ncbi:hypothetical protein [Sphingomonas sp. MM-1]|uniref:hypothetical protein n=1 Tax=Sphingomonas sp. MM-1 TaxID=745310 RepID=UPI003FA7C22E
MLATQQMLDEMRNIVAVLVGKALEGDTNAASIVLAKCLPQHQGAGREGELRVRCDRTDQRSGRPGARCHCGGRGRARCRAAHHRQHQIARGRAGQ